MSIATLGLTAGAVARELTQWSRRRVELGELTAMLVRAEPALEHAPERRQRLADVLAELADARVVELPSDRSYDHSARPPLPRFVRVQRAAATPQRRTGRDYAWRSELSWASALSFDARTLGDLRTVNAFLRDGGGERPIVPMRERSLELFGDEKRLDALLTTQVFAPERLTLGQLRCMEVHPPFVYQRIGAGPDALVIENHHTFVSFARALPPDGPVGVLIYGAGGHFKGSVTYAADLMPRPTRILYFGDIDPDGLDIPAYASRVATEHDLPAVQPAAALYRLLLDHGRPLPGGGAGRRVSVERSVAWLPDDLRGAAAGLLGDGQRLAQEWVGTELLASQRYVLAQL